MKVVSVYFEFSCSLFGIKFPTADQMSENCVYCVSGAKVYYAQLKSSLMKILSYEFAPLFTNKITYYLKHFTQSFR